ALEVVVVALEAVVVALEAVTACGPLPALIIGTGRHHPLTMAGPMIAMPVPRAAGIFFHLLCRPAHALALLVEIVAHRVPSLPVVVGIGVKPLFPEHEEETAFRGSGIHAMLIRCHSLAIVFRPHQLIAERQPFTLAQAPRVP